MSFRLDWDAQYVLDHPVMLKKIVSQIKKQKKETKGCIHNSTVTFVKSLIGIQILKMKFSWPSNSFLVNNQ